MAGELCPRLGAANPNSHRQSNTPADLSLNRTSVYRQIGCSDASHLEESLVDAVDLDFGAEPTQHRDESIAEVAIQLIVRTERQNTVLARELLDLEPRDSHLHAKVFDFLRSSHDTSVIVREHDDRRSR